MFWPALAAVVVWLLVCVVIDVRRHELPLLLTLIPYLLGAVYAAVRGEWPAALLSLLLIVISDLPDTRRRLVFAALVCAAVLLSPTDGGRWLAVAVGFLWLVWDVDPRIYGGSDARIIIALTLLSMDARIVLLLLFGMGFIGTLLKLFRGKPVPLTPGILAGMLLYAMLSRLPIFFS